jgi:hypothetical protein
LELIYSATNVEVFSLAVDDYNMPRGLHRPAFWGLVEPKLAGRTSKPLMRLRELELEGQYVDFWDLFRFVSQRTTLRRVKLDTVHDPKSTAKDYTFAFGKLNHLGANIEFEVINSYNGDLGVPRWARRTELWPTIAYDE